MRCSQPVGIKIGVLALQGNVSEHVQAFRLAGALEGEQSEDVEVVLVRHAGDIKGCDGIVIPGGESTTLSNLIDKNNMREALSSFEGGFFGTCAGMVLLATAVDDERVRPLSVLNISVDRNAFGRQRESFETDLTISGMDFPFHALFIRAPVAESAGPEVEILCTIDEGIVAIKQGRHMAFSFHPELGQDLRLHSLFLKHLND